MADASYAVPHFLGGEISEFAQGRFDKPDYRMSMRVCFNSYPVEGGAWTRRPGTRFAGTTRSGAPARVMKFDFEQPYAVTIEFTDGFIRFRNGATPIFTNDFQPIVAISAANPAVVQTVAAPGWPDRATGVILNLGSVMPLLHNRQFLLTPVDGTHYSLHDAITGGPIDGATLGAFTAGSVVARVHELTTPYIGGTWASIRAVQAETTDILLSPTVAPQALTVTTMPSAGVSSAFALSPAIFNDGPYLDPFTNGVQVTPDNKAGIISLQLSFPAYDATKAYAAGAFVTSVGINYKSLRDQNAGNTPATSPLHWAATGAGAAINNGQGFLGTDIGRQIRLFSEPLAWINGGSYTPTSIVSYNPTGKPDETLYYQSLVTSSATVPPGTDLTTWKIVPQGAAIWTWGKITLLSNVIDRALAGSTSIGDMAAGGGIGAAFNGAFSQTAAASAEATTSSVGSGSVSLTSYVGKNYAGAADQAIQQATIYPSSDKGFANGSNISISSITFNLRGKASLPAASSDGILLGTTALSNSFSAVSIVSSDQATAWKYVWIEQIVSAVIVGAGGPPGPVAYSLNNTIGQISLFNPPGTGTGSGCHIQILGPALLYTNPILTWRLGVYSDTTGWPTCGVYNDGRLYLGGAVGNRFDASVSNGIVGATVNFAPTDQYGAVPANSAISYTFNSDGVNPILWMDPDLQGIKMGTQAGEWLVQAPTAGPIAPANITARNVTKHGSANIQPCRTEHTTIFVQRFARKLLEYFPDVFSGKFSAPNLADKAEHIARNSVAELAYVSAVTPIIWGRDLLGALFGITYKRDSLASSQPPTFYGWHRHALGSGRVVESLCGGPSTGGDLDAVTMVTNDPLTGIRHVEVMTDAMDELDTLASAWYLDDAVIPSATLVDFTATTPAPYGGVTLYGLWHLNGKTVQILASGIDCGDPGEGKPFADFTVNNGSVFVPFGDGVSVGSGRGQFISTADASGAVVGFTYNSDGQVVRPILPADTGARNGPGFGKLSRAQRYALKLVNTLGLSVGTSFDKLTPANFKALNGFGIPPPPRTTFTGISQEALTDEDSYDRSLCWRVSRPWPANVVIAGVNLATKDQ